jgi:hypothetical protein
MKIRKLHWPQVSNSLFANIHDTTDLQPNSQPYLMVDSFTQADEIYGTFLLKYSIKHFGNDTMFAQIYSTLKAKNETLC